VRNWIRRIDIYQYLIDYQNNLEKWDLRGVTAWMKANAFINHLNAMKLVNELRHGVENGWGGFVEWMYIPANEPAWRFGPSVLHVLIPNPSFDPADDPALQEPRLLAYDPHIAGGAILTYSEKRYNYFHLPEILEPRRVSGEELSREWVDWQPDFIVLTCVNGRKHNYPIASKTLNPSERHFVDFRIDS